MPDAACRMRTLLCTLVVACPFTMNLRSLYLRRMLAGGRLHGATRQFVHAPETGQRPPARPRRRGRAVLYGLPVAPTPPRKASATAQHPRGY